MTSPQPSKDTNAEVAPERSDAEHKCLKALWDHFKQNGDRVLTWSEVLEVLRDLGYTESDGSAPPPSAPTSR